MFVLILTYLFCIFHLGNRKQRILMNSPCHSFMNYKQEVETVNDVDLTHFEQLIVSNHAFITCN